MYFFFVGYRNTQWARSFDLWILLGHFAIGMVIGLLYGNGLAQMISILAILILLFIITILIRPWNLLWLNIIDIVS